MPPFTKFVKLSATQLDWYWFLLIAFTTHTCIRPLTYSGLQGCISCGTCSYPELTEDHVLTSAYVKVFRIVTRNAANKSFWRKKDCSWPPLKQICNEYLMKFSENQSAPKLENRKTSPCSPCAPNLLHLLVSRILWYHNLCSPVGELVTQWTYKVRHLSGYQFW